MQMISHLKLLRTCSHNKREIVLLFCSEDHASIDKNRGLNHLGFRAYTKAIPSSDHKGNEVVQSAEINTGMRTELFCC